MPRNADVGFLVLLSCLLIAGCGQGERSARRGASEASADPARSTTPADPTPVAGPGVTAVGTAETSTAGADQQITGAATNRDPSFETVLAPIHDVEVFARLEGVVTALVVEEGHRVAAGATLARLDDRERKAVLAEREAEVERAEAAWNRSQKLRTEQVISDEEFIGARADWEIAKARRDKAKIDEEWCTVRSPIAGIVSLRRVQIGQLLKNGDLMFRVSDPSWLRAELLLPEAYLGRVRAGQRARLVASVAGRVVDAKVTRVNPLVDPGSGTFRVAIDVDNRRIRLPSGISAHVDLGLGSPPRER